MPPNVGVAIGCVMSIPDPLEYMIGSRPRTVVATVMSLGRNRATDPSTTASTYDCSGLRFASASRMNSIMMIPVWIATAKSDTYPMITAVVIENPYCHCSSTPPTSAKGAYSMMSELSATDLNAISSRPNMMMSVIGTTMRSLDCASCAY